MPLIILCGPPCSGKTELAQKLQSHLEQHEKCTVICITDDNCGVEFNKQQAYQDPTWEKKLRGQLKSCVQSQLSTDRVVILDSLNYIKSFRYELFCISKGCQTTQCVIYCDASKDSLLQWDRARAASSPDNAYGDDTISALQFRFEKPNPNQRWDSPLFYIEVDDEESVRNFSVEKVADAILRKKAPPPNQSTQSQPLSGGNYLQELDKMTQRVVQHILTEQKTCIIGNCISFPDNNGAKLLYKRPLLLNELQRTRRQFITFAKTRPEEDMSKSLSMFVQYLDNTL